MLLFTGRSLWTMVHGIVLGGGALMGLSAALFTLYATLVVCRAACCSAERVASARRPGSLHRAHAVAHRHWRHLHRVCLTARRLRPA